MLRQFWFCCCRQKKKHNMEQNSLPRCSAVAPCSFLTLAAAALGKGVGNNLGQKCGLRMLLKGKGKNIFWERWRTWGFKSCFHNLNVLYVTFQKQIFFLNSSATQSTLQKLKFPLMVTSSPLIIAVFHKSEFEPGAQGCSQGLVATACSLSEAAFVLRQSPGLPDVVFDRNRWLCP